jgi:hydroxyacylglutathione hydrolase
MIVETINVGPMQVNCYVLAAKEGSQAIIIDPGSQESKIRKVLRAHNLTPAMVINTHGHYDHIGCDDAFGVAVYVHQDDEPLLKDPARNLSSFFDTPCSVSSSIRLLRDNQIITLDPIELEVLHLPGHTPGGIALLLKKPEAGMVFTGDSLFSNSIGRTDFPGASEASLIRSIKEKLLCLPDTTVIYPGHGPSSTIKEERKNNPYIS